MQRFRESRPERVGLRDSAKGRWNERRRGKDLTKRRRGGGERRMSMDRGMRRNSSEKNRGLS